MAAVTATTLLGFSIACAAGTALHAWASGAVGSAGPAGFVQFMLLLVATPLLMTLAGLAYVLERQRRLRSADATPSRRFRGLMLGLVALLVLNWLLLVRLAPAG